MATLKAIYQDPKDPDRQRVVWIHELPEGKVISLGRVGRPTNPKDDNWSDWYIPEDDYISRRHAELVYQNGQLIVRPRRGTPPSNPIKYNRQPVNSLILLHGQRFSIGNTTFYLEDPKKLPNSDGTGEVPILREAIEHQSIPSLSLIDSSWVQFQDSTLIQLLQEMQQQFDRFESLEELERYILKSIIRGVARADVAAIVAIASNTKRDNISVMVRNTPEYRTKLPISFRPSRRLVYHALLEEHKTVLYVLNESNTAELFTSIPNTDWAICAPIFEREGFGWALYVSGRVDRIVASKEDLRADRDLRKYQLFIMVVAQLFGLQSKMRDLEREVLLVRRFLPSKVINQIDPSNLEVVLQPCKTNVAALFCDLRGASNHAERGIDNLIETWKQINSALVVMTESIDHHHGVIADLQGDAALGFWGWPAVPHQERIINGPEHPIEQSAMAALEIIRRFPGLDEAPTESEVARFRCGIGLAYGPAVAGRLGTPQQYKIDVFGPVVNLASRLEGLTKKLEVSILIEDAMAEHLKKYAEHIHVRRLFRVIPAGMGIRVTLHELLPAQLMYSQEQWKERDTNWHLAVQQFESGDWDASAQQLKQLLKQPDFRGPSQFLLQHMEQAKWVVPPAWDGVLRLETK